MLLYDTLTRGIKPLRASDGRRFRFYGCGPTVYGPAHIGNFRTFINLDILYRVLQLAGLQPYYVRNLTDVDDNTIKHSQRENLPLDDFTARWIELFRKDCATLNILEPDVEPRATDHLPQQITLIQALIDRGHAYWADDGSVYYDVSSFPEYGRLAGLEAQELRSQATTSGGAPNLADHYDRESVADFALWKAHKPDDGDNAWPSPWGEGRPGWHIECSAMSLHHLGNGLDLHGAGADLCFPHHDNEIAQSEGATGETFAHHWMHSAMLRVESEKMSKSLGNIHTVGEILEMGFSPMTLRYALLAGHYRQPLNFTHNGLHAAASALQRLERTLRPLLLAEDLSAEEFIELHRNEPVNWSIFSPAWDELTNDLNVPGCLGEIFGVLNRVGPDSLRGILPAFSNILFALGLNPLSDPAYSQAPADIVELAEVRWRAREKRDFERSDTLRQQIAERGWQIRDRRDGYDLTPLAPR